MRRVFDLFGTFVVFIILIVASMFRKDARDILNDLNFN